MELISPRKANKSSAGKEIACILCQPNISYLFQNISPHFPILSQINPVNRLPILCRLDTYEPCKSKGLLYLPPDLMVSNFTLCPHSVLAVDIGANRLNL